MYMAIAAIAAVVLLLACAWLYVKGWGDGFAFRGKVEDAQRARLERERSTLTDRPALWLIIAAGAGVLAPFWFAR